MVRGWRYCTGSSSFVHLQERQYNLQGQPHVGEDTLHYRSGRQAVDDCCQSPSTWAQIEVAAQTVAMELSRCSHRCINRPLLCRLRMQGRSSALAKILASDKSHTKNHSIGYKYKCRKSTVRSSFRPKYVHRMSLGSDATCRSDWYTLSRPWLYRY